MAKISTKQKEEIGKASSVVLVSIFMFLLFLCCIATVMLFYLIPDLRDIVFFQTN